MIKTVLPAIELLANAPATSTGNWDLVLLSLTRLTAQVQAKDRQFAYYTQDLIDTAAQRMKNSRERD
ncbi:MAG: hypothetical protein WDN28_22000 [Chthoniobacter sp.]